MITQEQFVCAIETMRLQRYEDKKNGELLQEAFSLNEFPIFENSKLYNQILDLLGIWFDRKEIADYCFVYEFGKLDGETADELFERVKK